MPVLLLWMIQCTLTLPLPVSSTLQHCSQEQEQWAGGVISQPHLSLPLCPLNCSLSEENTPAPGFLLCSGCRVNTEQPRLSWTQQSIWGNTCNSVCMCACVSSTIYKMYLKFNWGQFDKSLWSNAFTKINMISSISLKEECNTERNVEQL